MVPQIETVGLKLLLSFGYFQSTWFITFTAAFLQWSLDKFYFLLFFFFLLRGLIWIHHVPYLQWTHWTGPLYELCWKLDLNGRGDWVTLLWHWDDSWKHPKIMEAVAEKIDWLKRNVWIRSQLLELEAGKETDFKPTFWYSLWFAFSCARHFMFIHTE